MYNKKAIKISEKFFIAFPDMLVFEWLTFNIIGCITRIMQSQGIFPSNGVSNTIRIEE